MILPFLIVGAFLGMIIYGLAHIDATEVPLMQPRWCFLKQAWVNHRGTILGLNPRKRPAAYGDDERDRSERLPLPE